MAGTSTIPAPLSAPQSSSATQAKPSGGPELLPNNVPPNGARQFLLRAAEPDSEEIFRLVNCRSRSGKFFSEVAYYPDITALASAPNIPDHLVGPIDDIGLTKWEGNTIRAGNARRGFRFFESHITGNGPVLNKAAGTWSPNIIDTFECFGDGNQFVYSTTDGTACSTVYYCTKFGPFGG